MKSTNESAQYVLDNGFFTQNYVNSNGQRIAQCTAAWEGSAAVPGELYIHEDITGSARRFTDGNGAIFGEIEYDVWGLPTVRAGNGGENYEDILNPRYTNHTYDDVLNMYHAQFRFFDAGSKGFTQEDPVKDRLNWYEYCIGNPTSTSDPLGLEASYSLNYGSGLESAMIEAWFHNDTMSIDDYREYFPSSMCLSEKKELAQKGYMLLDRFNKLTQEQIEIFKKMSPASRQFWLEGIDIFEGKSRLEEYYFPYDLRETHKLGKPLVSQNFGAKRPVDPNLVAERTHAGIDIYPTQGKYDYVAGVPIYAVTDGIVIPVTDGFLTGQTKNKEKFSVDAIAVQSKDGSIIRYTELNTKVKENDSVYRGITVIGETAHMKTQTMLHIEVYTGEVDKSIALTQKGNHYTPYVDHQKYKKLPFERRADMVDPSIFGILLYPEY